MPEALPPKLKVVNLFGPPGKGKSTVRSGLFWLMRSYRVSAEEVSEYAKYLVLSGRRWQLQEEQLYLLSKQHHKQLILRGKYEFAVTDSPLQLCDFYAPDGYLQTFGPLVDEVWNGFENINFYLTRDECPDEFEATGRNHNFDEAQAIDRDMRQFLDSKGIQYTELKIDLYTPWRILEILKPGLAKPPVF